MEFLELISVSFIVYFSSKQAIWFAKSSKVWIGIHIIMCSGCVSPPLICHTVDFLPEWPFINQRERAAQTAVVSIITFVFNDLTIFFPNYPIACYDLLPDPLLLCKFSS